MDPHIFVSIMPWLQWRHTLILKIILFITGGLANACKGCICKVNIKYYGAKWSPNDLFTLNTDFLKPHFPVLLQLAVEKTIESVNENILRWLCCKSKPWHASCSCREMLTPTSFASGDSCYRLFTNWGLLASSGREGSKWEEMIYRTVMGGNRNGKGDIVS